jgi:hypothetical protein
MLATANSTIESNDARWGPTLRIANAASAISRFARNHVVASEIYRLSEDDLRLLEWLPVEEFSAMAGQF